MAKTSVNPPSGAYRVPSGPWQTELEIKRSKFLSFVYPASHREQADEAVRELRRLHPQANHVCWAYIAGSPDTTVRSMSDDGEPSGTAGMPMLKVLEHSGLGEIVVAVVRYFGGTKLGTGGLQRAYSDAVAGALQNLPSQLKVPTQQVELTYDYSIEGPVSRLLAGYQVDIIDSQFAEQVKLVVALPEQHLLSIRQQLTDLSSGQLIFTPTQK